ncbi:hypothetical protein V7S43_005550 [Phytophthora oleae]|uniref:RanBP2-type domain-containing protein n=1 Tax=Phytophthora oleae TaxID=2107226 RepID=A0ABD3FS76_9STRA
MSSWVVTDETPTASVVWMAAEQIGKAQNHEQLQKICDYLVNKHWFQTAGDLRSARRETTEWQALEVPGRLKLAIQQVLDQILHHEVVPNYGYEEYYAAVRPSLTPGSETTTQDWAEATTETEQATSVYYSSGYTYTSSDTTSDSTQYYDQTDYAPPSYDESLTTSYQGNYYSYSNAEVPSNYDSGAAADALLSLQGSRDEGEEVVEAHTVEEESAIEGELAPDQASYAVELGEPAQHDASDTTGNWSCGQCTYMNPMTSSFCEMCIGHISLSPDVKTTAGTSVSASLLVPAKSVVDVEMNSPQAASFPQSQLSSVTCLLPSVGSLYPPSAPDFDEPIDPSPLPPPLPYPGTSSCGNVDFLALAFSGSSAPKTQAAPSYTGKSSQMRREEAANTTEYTF